MKKEKSSKVLEKIIERSVSEQNNTIENNKLPQHLNYSSYARNTNTLLDRKILL